MACSLGFYGDGISFRVVFSQSLWLRVLPGGARLVQPRWMPERRILEGGQTGGFSFWPFLNSSAGWRLISSLFLTRTSSCITTHANGYYGAWPGWAVSISVLPLTYPYNGILLSNKKKLLVHITTWMNLRWLCWVKGAWLKMSHTVWIHLYGIQKDKTKETSAVVTRGQSRWTVYKGVFCGW